MVGLFLAAAEGEGGSNPILPEVNEIIWGGLSFLILLVLIIKKGFPAIKKGIDARAERIAASLAEADKARDEAQAVLADYKRQVADAKNEAARIIEEARQSADKLRQDMRAKAEAEVAEIKQRAVEDNTAQVTRTMAELQARVSLLAIELAEKVVQENLDREANMRLVERFIREMESTS
ncbi:MAG: F0F1 ATP synthase subunit B [Actinomycetota bacterium]|jgi:F-type H+-transporting ATPase subunit b